MRPAVLGLSGAGYAALLLRRHPGTYLAQGLTIKERTYYLLLGLN